jgi:hypothetical protein
VATVRIDREGERLLGRIVVRRDVLELVVVVRIIAPADERRFQPVNTRAAA